MSLSGARSRDYPSVLLAVAVSLSDLRYSMHSSLENAVRRSLARWFRLSVSPQTCFCATSRGAFGMMMMATTDSMVESRCLTRSCFPRAACPYPWHCLMPEPERMSPLRGPSVDLRCCCLRLAYMAAGHSSYRCLWMQGLHDSAHMASAPEIVDCWYWCCRSLRSGTASRRSRGSDYGHCVCPDADLVAVAAGAGAGASIAAEGRHGSASQRRRQELQRTRPGGWSG